MQPPTTHSPCTRTAQDEAVRALSKTAHTPRNMPHTTAEPTSTFSPCTRTPSHPSARPISTSPTFHSSGTNSATTHNKRVSTMWLVYAPLQVTSPKILQKKDDLCVKPLFFHRPSTTSTYDSSESIASLPPESDLFHRRQAVLLNTRIYVSTPCPSTNKSQHRPTILRKASRHRPLDSDLDDEQLRALQASPLYLQEREASADRSQVCYSVRENLVSSASQVQAFPEPDDMRCADQNIVQ